VPLILWNGIVFIDVWDWTLVVSSLIIPCDLHYEFFSEITKHQ